MVLVFSTVSVVILSLYRISLVLILIRRHDNYKKQYNYIQQSKSFAQCRQS